MKFKFIISKWANFYFFVSNLSEWHFSARKNYNILWREELGPFSEEEENSIKQFKKIRQNYGSSKTFFEQAFFLEEIPFNILQKNLSMEEFNKIKIIFEILENKFNIVYKKDFPLLQKWQQELTNEANDKTIINNITNILATLYNVSKPEKEIDAYLLLSGAKQTGGGANINDECISIEISRWPLGAINHVLGIIWHEAIHLVFEKKYFKPLIDQHYPDIEKQGINIREITIALLFPRGILGQKFLKNLPPGPAYFGKLNNQKNDFFLLMMSYINQNKKLDIPYIQNIISVAQKEN